MDPETRRKGWELIREEKKRRLIVLSTHYMDEAEALADRIAIMRKGKIVTIGFVFFPFFSFRIIFRHVYS